MFDVILDITGVAAAVGAIVVALYVCFRSERPQVVAYLEHDRDHGCVYFVVANAGSGVARDVRLQSFDYVLVQEQHRNQVRKTFVENGIPVLAPGSACSTIIATGSMSSALLETAADIIVSYSWTRKFPWWPGKETERYRISYGSLAGSMYSKSDIHEIAQQLKTINKQLTGINRSLSKIAAGAEHDAPSNMALSDTSGPEIYEASGNEVEG